MSDLTISKANFTYSKNLVKVLGVAWAITILLIGSYLMPSSEQSEYVNSEALNNVIVATQKTVSTNRYLYGQPVNWQGPIIEVSEYTNLDDYKPTLAEFESLVAYWLHRYDFANKEEQSAIANTFPAMRNALKYKATANTDYLTCLVASNCNYKQLVVEHPSSRWVAHWAAQDDIENLQAISDKLIALDVNVIEDVTFFNFRKESVDRPIVPPAIADYLVTIPFYENCENNHNQLMLYLYEIKTHIPLIKDLVDYYMGLAKEGRCD